jgi:polyisoprenoid-binding protein YceI
MSMPAKLIHSLISCAALIACSPAALAGQWALLAPQSSLEFTGEVEDAPFTGEFERFSADVQFDPDAPAAGSIEAVVDVKSVNSRNRDRDQYMVAKDFFYARKFPEARFRTTAIRPGEQGDYVAEAELTLRGETRPVQMRFTFTPGEPARLRGTVDLKRLDFGVGQGEWRSTREIADEVRVTVDLALAAR